MLDQPSPSLGQGRNYAASHTATLERIKTARRRPRPISAYCASIRSSTWHKTLELDNVGISGEKLRCPLWAMFVGSEPVSLPS